MYPKKKCSDLPYGARSVWIRKGRTTEPVPLTDLFTDRSKVMYERIPRPVVVSDFVKIYTPSADIYNGVDTNNFKHGIKYTEWITNDFSPLLIGDTWHIVGITHPRPKSLVDDYNYSPDDVHEAEYQLFHCTASGKRFGDIFYENSFTDREKILYPQSRPGEANEIWAPHMMLHEDKVKIVYSPRNMRVAETTDFKSFKTGKVLFETDSFSARDPYIFLDKDIYYCFYAIDNRTEYRTSRDFVSWSEAHVLQVNPWINASNESPFIMKRGKYYYLLWCICDGRCGCYDNRTFVFASDTIDGLADTAPIAMLPGHAPEIITDDSGSYLLSVYYPENGISAAKIDWVT
jgi:hypothetical protein